MLRRRLTWHHSAATRRWALQIARPLHAAEGRIRCTPSCTAILLVVVGHVAMGALHAKGGACAEQFCCVELRSGKVPGAAGWKHTGHISIVTGWHSSQAGTVTSSSW